LYFNWLLFHYFYRYCSNHDPERNKMQSLVTEREVEGDKRSGIKSYLDLSGSGKAAEHARNYSQKNYGEKGF
jgi:hypothetical protein